MNTIKTLLERKGILQKQFAIDIGVSQPTVSDWINNKKDPRGENLQKVAQYFGVAPSVIKGVDPLRDERQERIEYEIAALTDSEKKLIRRFRELDEDDQEAVLYRALELVKAKDADVQREKNQAV